MSVALRVSGLGAEVGKGVCVGERSVLQGPSGWQDLENHGGEFDTILRAVGSP